LTASSEGTAPDVARLVEVLDRHGVDYLVVGGVATRFYGAERPTWDFDCLVRRTRGNFERLAMSMRELNARLRVEGMTDDEAAELPTQVHAETIARMEISTWRTDAGDLDVLVDIPNRQGHRMGYDDLVVAARSLDQGGLVVKVAGLSDIIASKEWADRPKDHEALPELHVLQARLDQAEE